MCWSSVHAMKTNINLFSRKIIIYCTLRVAVLWTKISTQNVKRFSSYAVSVANVLLLWLISECPFARTPQHFI